MHHFPDYVQAIHADRLREAEAARRAYACLARRRRRLLPLRVLLHRWVTHPSRSRAPNAA